MVPQPIEQDREVSVASTRAPSLTWRRLETLNTVRVQFSAASTRAPSLSWRRVETLCARSSLLSWRRVYASRFVRDHDLQYLRLTSRIGRELGAVYCEDQAQAFLNVAEEMIAP
ncbi:hypothetical protein NDU88_004861 [Pleurodeles waltl]|uniref:Uncharacterized protein n=1 Tax=Pleurodeles waltl TaxID=8319 RepID=A0AAV7SK08_PLEWA|nr:hypothetical protein NDU88_004861 [Pleurodeles waltl]